MSIKHLVNYLYISIFIVTIFSPTTTLAKSASNETPINFYEIKEYAELANFAYQTSANLKKSVFLNNYKLIHRNTIKDIGISYFLITNTIKKTHIIAIRGTTNIENTIANLSLKLVFDKKTGIYLHRGFLVTAEAVYTELKPYLIKGYTINTTGHSLGGAVALILAMKLEKYNFKSGKIITFGQPKITNILGAYIYNHLPIIRIVTQKDLVPLVPFIDPMDINDLDVYWHQGKEVLLLPGTNYSILEGIDSMLRATKFTQEPITENNFIHHQMKHYLQLINEKISGSKLVPFKNNLNLFNLFSNNNN